MSAQPDHAPVPLSAPAPAAPAQLRAQLEAHRPAWLPAFERDWATALDDARHSFSLAPLDAVVIEWQSQLAAAPAVDAFLADGQDDSDGIAVEYVLGARP